MGSFVVIFITAYYNMKKQKIDERIYKLDENRLELDKKKLKLDENRLEFDKGMLSVEFLLKQNPEMMSVMLKGMEKVQPEDYKLIEEYTTTRFKEDFEVFKREKTQSP